jgi:hypothetical protein
VPTVRVRQYLFGPRFTVPVDDRFDVFAPVLAGALNRTTDGDSHNGLGLGLGGGFDTRFSQHFVGRMFADWRPAKFRVPGKPRARASASVSSPAPQLA